MNVWKSKLEIRRSVETVLIQSILPPKCCHCIFVTVRVCFRPRESIVVLIIGRYLGEDPTANEQQRQAEIRKEIKTRFSAAGLDEETRREVLDRVVEDGEEW